MKLTVVRYKMKPETAEENARLIQAVFQELRAKSPEDVRYLALRLGDGTFIHFSIAETNDGANPIPQLEAFRSLQLGFKERCIESPQQSDATIVGNYRMFDWRPEPEVRAHRAANAIGNFGFKGALES